MEEGGPPQRDPRDRRSMILRELRRFVIFMLILAGISLLAFGICLALTNELQ